MSVARGTKYLQETKLRQQEGQRAKTEARIVQLKLTDLETRISNLERFKQEIKGKSTARSLPFGSFFLSTSLLLFLFPSTIFLCLYVVPSWPRSIRTKQALAIKTKDTIRHLLVSGE
jgi:hypothetical protein